MIATIRFTPAPSAPGVPFPDRPARQRSGGAAGGARLLGEHGVPGFRAATTAPFGLDEEVPTASRRVAPIRVGATHRALRAPVAERLVQRDERVIIGT